MAPRHELNVVCAWSDADFLATLTGDFAGEAAIHFGEILLLESWRGLDRIALALQAATGIGPLGLSALWRGAEAGAPTGSTRTGSPTGSSSGPQAR